MLRRLILLAVAFFALFAALAPADAGSRRPKFRLVDLRVAVPPTSVQPKMAGEWVMARGIRLDASGRPVDTHPQTLRRQRGGKWEVLENMPAAFAADISNSGEVVGIDHRQYFLWSKSGVSYLSFPAMGLLSPAISPDGRYVAGGNYSLAPDRRPDDIESQLLDRQTNELKSLGDMIPNAVNDIGDVVGARLYQDGEEWHYEATAHFTDGFRLTLPRSQFLAINDQRELTGYQYYDGFGSIAFLFQRNYVLEMGQSGGLVGRANAINSYGEVVGESGGKAFIGTWWRNPMDLNRLTSGLGNKWRLKSALAINMRGEILVQAERRLKDGNYREQLVLLQPRR